MLPLHPLFAAPVLPVPHGPLPRLSCPDPSWVVSIVWAFCEVGALDRLGLLRGGRFLSVRVSREGPSSEVCWLVPGFSGVDGSSPGLTSLGFLPPANPVFHVLNLLMMDLINCCMPFDENGERFIFFELQALFHGGLPSARNA